MFYVYTYFFDGVPQYVGKGVRNRWKAHRNAPSHLGRKLQQIKQSAGEWVTPVIVDCENEAAALVEEKRLIKLYGREDLGTGTLYNLTEGGDVVSGFKMPEQAKKILKAKHSGSNNPFYGKTHTAEVRQQLSEQHRGNTNTLGTKLTNEHKQKISMSISGDNNPACKVKKAEYSKLFQLRLQGMTQKQIGAVMGITQSQVSKILKGTI